MNKKLNRKQQILETLALQIENDPGKRITTAGLAKAIGVSEATLYRHFASKAKMFEALIDFSEDIVFGSINKILLSNKNVVIRFEKIIYVLLVFAERNPGIICVLAGNALVNEDKRLQRRAQQFFERLEAQFRQILREANLDNDIVLAGTIDPVSNQILVFIEGKIAQFIRTSFRKKTTDHYLEQWQNMKRGLFK